MKKIFLTLIIILELLIIKIPEYNELNNIAIIEEISVIKQNNKYHITFSLKNAKVYGKDLKSLVPELENLNKPFIANGRVSYYNNNLDLHGFQATYGDNMLMKLSTTVRGIDKIEDTYIFANIQQISTKVQDLEDLISDNGKPQFIQAGALSETSLPHSGHFISAIFILLYSI